MIEKSRRELINMFPEVVKSFPEWSKDILISAKICNKCGRTTSHPLIYCGNCGGKFDQFKNMSLYTYIEFRREEMEKAIFINKLDYSYRGIFHKNNKLKDIFWDTIEVLIRAGIEYFKISYDKKDTCCLIDSNSEEIKIGDKVKFVLVGRINKMLRDKQGIVTSIDISKPMPVIVAVEGKEYEVPPHTLKCVL